jgi:hypothetical protein
MYLAHIPVNHHLRPIYRALAGLAGLYLLVFGVIGIVQAAGLDPFAQDDLPRVFGQPVNPAQAVLDIVLGAVIVVVVVLGRNWDHYVNFWLGQLVLVIGLAELTVLRTDANILGYAMPNVIVIFTIGLLVLAGSLYGKVGSTEAVAAERAFAQRAA